MSGKNPDDGALRRTERQCPGPGSRTPQDVRTRAVRPVHRAEIPRQAAQLPHYDAWMNESVPTGRRTLHRRGPLRRALLDTSVLTTDIIAGTRRHAPSSFVAGARAGTVRCLIPVHVWEEVPRVLADRHLEGGRFDHIYENRPERSFSS